MVGKCTRKDIEKLKLFRGAIGKCPSLKSQIKKLKKKCGVTNLSKLR